MGAKVGRNEACACGSGLKYKKCCGLTASSTKVPPVTPPPDIPMLLRLLGAGRHAELETQVRSQLTAHPKSVALWKLLAAALHGMGKDAVEALETATRLAPQDAEAHTNLGNGLRARGQPARAVDAHRRAIEIDPLYAKAHLNLGSALRDLRQLQDALVAFSEARRLDPKFALAHHNLGITLKDLGRPDEAVAAHRQALALAPDLADAHAQLGSALREIGKADEALSSYRRALLLQPEHVEALLHLADLLLAQGRPEQAIDYYQRLVRLWPGKAQVHANLGHALREAGDPTAARAACECAVQLMPDSAEMHMGLGNAHADLGAFESAEASYRRALELNPGLTKAFGNLGLILRELGRITDAEQAYRQALQQQPDSPEILTQLAIVQRLLGQVEAAEHGLNQALQLSSSSAATVVALGDLAADRGDFPLAEQRYREAFALDPGQDSAWANITATRKMLAEDRDWLIQAEALAARRPLKPRSEVALNFALGKFHDDVGQYDQAFTHYHRANERVKQYRPPHDRLLLEDTFRFVRGLYDANWVNASRARTQVDHQPIFIVGMPRSGTSLAEQILASHPEVFGAGELPFWKVASLDVGAASLESGPGPERVEPRAAEYDALLRRLAQGQRHVVDKMPANFAHLGMIHAALPDARIIHMQRNPIDTCLSIYFQNFHVAHSYSNDLDDLAHYYDEYRRLMQHWAAVLPQNRLLEVPYEALVSEPEHWTRRMLEFAGLPWDEACLNFHRTHREVRTFSRWQVRQQISKGSVARWRRYAAHVGPLLRLDPEARV